MQRMMKKKSIERVYSRGFARRCIGRQGSDLFDENETCTGYLQGLNAESYGHIHQPSMQQITYSMPGFWSVQQWNITVT